LIQESKKTKKEEQEGSSIQKTRVSLSSETKVVMGKNPEIKSELRLSDAYLSKGKTQGTRDLELLVYVYDMQITMKKAEELKKITYQIVF